MATITSTAAGNWSAGGTWIGGVAPVNGDKAVINHTVTIDDTAREVGVDAATDSILIGAAGTLKWSRAANSTLTVHGAIKLNANGAQFDMGKVGDEIPAGIAAKLVLNKATSPSWMDAITQNGTLTSYGFYIAGNPNITRVTKITGGNVAAGSHTFNVVSATGWAVGDEIVLGHSDNTNPSSCKFEKTTITGISGNAVTATLAFSHLNGCFVGNVSSNVEVSAYDASGNASIVLTMGGLTAQTIEVRNTRFKNVGNSVNNAGGIRFADGSSSSTLTPVKSFYGNAMISVAGYNGPGHYGLNGTNRKFKFDSCISYADPTFAGASVAVTSGSTADFDNCLLLAGQGITAVSGNTLFASIFSNGWMSIVGTSYFCPSNTPGLQFSNTIFSGVGIAYTPSALPTPVTFAGCDLGYTHGWHSAFGDKMVRNGGSIGQYWTYTATDTYCGADLDVPQGDADRATGSNLCSAVYVNKNADVTWQETYTAYGKIFRQNALKKNATSSVSIQPTVTGKDVPYSFLVPCANGSSINLLGNVKYDALFYNGGTWTAPTVTISGLGIAPQVFTAASGTAKTCTISNASPAVVTATAHGFTAGQKISFVTTGSLPTGLTAGVEYYVLSAGLAANTFRVASTYEGTAINTSSAGSGTHSALSWQQYSLTATNSSGADGNFTVSLTANASAVTTGTAYFDGCPTNSPYVTKCRFYGYTFDQTNPVRTVNGAVVANEATANALTGVSVAGGASVSPITVTASTTFQNVYDFTQAWSCRAENFVYAAPCSAPVAGTLVAASSVTVNTAQTLNGPGSLTMGGFTLTTEFGGGGGTYTYTAGTWSQLSTIPSFSGGTLNLPAEGTYVFTAAGSIITFAPSANAVTYHLGGGTYSGTIDLRNTHASRAITVELPAGTTYTTANNTGAAITVSTPAIYQSVTVSGAAAGSRIQIYDLTSSTELYNGTPAFPYTWTDPTPAASTRAIRLRVAKMSTVTAKNFIDAAIGTCATSGAGKDISYLVAQTDDTVYNANAIDGSAVAGITISVGPSRVNINIGGGSVTCPSIYAYQVYWQATATGIAQETAFMTAPDTANYISTTFQVKNTSATPLQITGGWLRDSVTGTVAGCIDAAGSTGNIYAEPDHVVAYATGSALTAGQAISLANADGARVLEGALTFDQVMRIIAAPLVGTVAGAGTGVETFKGLDGTTSRVVSTNDASGNRTSVVVNGA